jgi:hypothetical protein
MPRISLSFLVNLVLLFAVLVLGWALYDRGARAEGTHVSTQTTSQGLALPASTRDPDAMSAIAARLAAIDARLSAIEHNAPSASPGAADQAQKKRPISPQAAAVANQRLAAIVSGHHFDQNAMVEFNMQLAKLPEDEQIALAAALTQAINQGRVKLMK